MMDRDLLLNGRCTGPLGLVISPISAKASSWFGSSSEYNSNNEWIVNFGSGNCNNTNKNNSNLSRAVVALDEQVLVGWITAFEDCCLHKMSSVDCTMYRLGATFDLVILAAQIEILYNYRPGTSICFYVSYPRVREIFAAAFRDRIVQHWICIRLEPLFEERHRSLGDVTYNCRVGFGTMAAAERAARDTAIMTNNYTEDGYVATIDVWSFFMSIDKNVTWALLKAFILANDERIVAGHPDTDIQILLWLVEMVVMHCPQDDCQFRGNQGLRLRLDPWKSLMNALKHIGLAIGNITSQDFANFIMSYIDEWAVTFCKPRGMVYVRFVDDMFLGAKKKEDILEFRRELCRKMEEILHQRIHPKKFYIQPARHGVKFVGRIIKPGRTYTGNRTVGNFYNAIKKIDAHCGIMLKHGVSVGSIIELEHQASSVNSLFGFLVHSASFKIRVKGISQLRNFWKFGYVANAHIIRIKKQYKLQNYLIQKRDEENSECAAFGFGDRIQLIPSEKPYNQFRHRGARGRHVRVRVGNHRTGTVRQGSYCLGHNQVPLRPAQDGGYPEQFLEDFGHWPEKFGG